MEVSVSRRQLLALGTVIVLVPALRSVVKRVDLAEGVMLLDAKRLDEVAVFDED